MKQGLLPLPTPAEMSAWDKAAIAFGIPEFVLMENASREALHVLASRTPVAGQRVLLFMGGGNNGGDAACLARHLLDAGAEPLVLHTRPLGACRGTAGKHVRLARKAGVSFAPAAGWPERFRGTEWDPLSAGPQIVVDGLLGTGFHGQLRERELGLIRAMNDLSRTAFLYALDIPSGLSGLTGKPLPEAVRARLTVTFQAAKPGLVLPEAGVFTGELVVRPIGMPRSVMEACPASFAEITSEISRLRVRPTADWHKGRAGKVLVAGGSAGLTGAPHLAALAALRSGAGLVTLAAPAALCADIRAGSPDLMTFSLGQPEDRNWIPAMAAALAERATQVDALVLGPGLGRSEHTGAFLAEFLRLPRPRCVLDADALYALSRHPELYALLREDDLLTPHPGEAAFLLGEPVAAVQQDRPAALAGLRALAPAVWVLKGAGTLLGGPNSPVLVAPFAAPNLAVGGSGDVLSGCLGALLAALPEVSALEVAALGVYLHARAGQRLAGRYPLRGNSASDIADALAEDTGESR